MKKNKNKGGLILVQLTRRVCNPGDHSKIPSAEPDDVIRRVPRVKGSWLG